MPRSAKPLKGRRFGSVTVLSSLGRNEHGNSKWLCRCDCGATMEVWYQNLTTGRTRSCGCSMKKKQMDTFWD